jgi:hypothetical protein
MKEDCKIIRNAVSKELCQFLALEYEMMEEVCKSDEVAIGERIQGL